MRAKRLFVGVLAGAVLLTTAYGAETLRAGDERFVVARPDAEVAADRTEGGQSDAYAGSARVQKAVAAAERAMANLKARKDLYTSELGQKTVDELLATYEQMVALDKAQLAALNAGNPSEARQKRHETSALRRTLYQKMQILRYLDRNIALRKQMQEHAADPAFIKIAERMIALNTERAALQAKAFELDAELTKAGAALKKASSQTGADAAGAQLKL